MVSFSRLAALGLGLFSKAYATILQNGQIRATSFPDTRIDPSTYSFTTYPADAPEISYKGRWDSQHVSWWSGLGIKFGYTGQTVAQSLGNLTSDGVLVGYRIAGLGWIFTNATAGATHLLIDAVHVAKGENLIKMPGFGRRIEVIGGSLASGMYTTYEELSSWSYGLGAELGNTEHSITAYPGICAADQDCWGNPRGQVHQWFYTSDTSYRASVMHGDNPEPWDFSKQSPADIVVINIGTNDNNQANNVSNEAYIDAVTKIIQGVHGKWPKAQVIVMSLWLSFYQSGNAYLPNAPEGWPNELYQMVEWAYTSRQVQLGRVPRQPIVYDGVTKKTSRGCKKAKPFVHYFNTTGTLQHNDIAPQWHPTDVGAIKVASHPQQFIRIKFGWDLYATGPEVFHETLYWNHQSGY
ncbi:Lipase, GDSL-like protein [Parathielavia hyrcaniae]|uniref:Lipase, GDSL-like protein n=1 Tax=Parathielavia hyrcaniae TaxID=113614 RepID=A0AAN6Q746_9PEZI|nr:Lipase, GDSL-like protein [Parathielavia hyrcaniae]